MESLLFNLLFRWPAIYEWSRPLISGPFSAAAADAPAPASAPAPVPAAAPAPVPVH